MENLRNKLLAAGITLNVGAAETTIGELEALLRCSVPPSIREIYSHFNGFESPAPRSQIQFWAIERIIVELDLEFNITGSRYLPIADFMIDSDFFLSPIGSDVNPVLKLDQSRVSDSVLDFLHQIADGAHDF